MPKLKPKQVKFQIGKNGLTDGVLNSISLIFTTHKQVRISLLKSAITARPQIEEIANKIKSSLVGKFSFRIIGFTIIISKLK